MAQLLKKSAKKVVAAKVSSVKAFVVSKSASSSALKPSHQVNPNKMMTNPASAAFSRYKKPTNVHHVVKSRPIARSPLPTFNDQNSLIFCSRTTNNANSNVVPRKDSFSKYKQKQPISKSPIQQTRDEMSTANKQLLQKSTTISNSSNNGMMK